jgi:Ala-tRNA(Pro) deacylase
MAVAPAACVIDFRGLARVLGRGPVRPVSDAELARAVRDCPPDALPPFGALYDMPTIVDHRLLRAREITMRAGDHSTLLRMRVTEYRRLAVPRVGDFAIPESLLGRRAIGAAPAADRKAG